MSDLYTNKKHANNHLRWFLVGFSLAILCGVCYKKGMERTQVDAVYLGYAAYDDEGVYGWKSKRLIGLGE